MGIAREEIAPSLRSFPVDKFLIFYRLTKQGIEVVRILPGQKDIERIFREGE